MRVWRLLVEIAGPEVWTFLVVARDGIAAWRVVRAHLPRRLARGASLEELEGSGERRAGEARVLRAWRVAPARRRGSPSDEAPLVA